ncbi:MarR family transcriptional regulator [Myxococcaceae bacterium JPH2]|nr:MarR family transcriptional regulator [Myxococcaceae bacterium JPH2]
MPVAKSEAASLLTDSVLWVCRLAGGFMDAAARIAVPAGLTAASWKVLGATLEEPRTVAEIGRNMGLARQSVQRLADILVSEGRAPYLDNPAHRSARLLTPTRAGRAAMDRPRERQSRWANAVSEGLGKKALAQCRATLRGLVERTEQVEAEARESD